MNLLYGFLFSAFISFLAYKKESLSKSGAVAATLVSALLIGFDAYMLWFTLMAFFASSSLLTKFKRTSKREQMEQNEKGGKRDYLQVLANGFLPVMFAGLYYVSNNIIFNLLSAVTIASSNSDTWASELGVLSKGSTRSIVNFKPIQQGISGGVSLLGTIVAIIGAGFIAFIYTAQLFIFGSVPLFDVIFLFIVVSAGGVLGCLIDSYLGATIQAKYICPVCSQLTEKRQHHNQKTAIKSGLAFMTNDVINFSSALIASLIILIFSLLFRVIS